MNERIPVIVMGARAKILLEGIRDRYFPHCVFDFYFLRCPFTGTFLGIYGKIHGKKLFLKKTSFFLRNIGGCCKIRVNPLVIKFFNPDEDEKKFNLSIKYSEDVEPFKKERINNLFERVGFRISSS
jgi:hypothetical protein